nr:hypothetical protein [Tanacetum cinerariifolium]
MAPVYMEFLRFMGDENDTRNYRYSLEVGGNGRKLIWEGTPRSIRDGHRKVRDSHGGMIIQRNMALFFSGGDRKELKLRVTGQIWKESPNSDEDKGENPTVEQVKKRAKTLKLLKNYGIPWKPNIWLRMPQVRSSLANPNKKPKVTCWKCEKHRHLKEDCKAGNVGNIANGSSTKGSEDGSSNPLKGSAFMSTSKLNDLIIWHARLGHVNFKKMQDMSKDELISSIDMDTEKCERGIECIFVGYAEHSKAFRFYVIEPNDSVAINSIIESRDDIFDEQMFSSVLKPSQRSLDDPKTFDEAIKSQDVAFWKEVINYETDSIMGNNTWVLTDLPPGCKPLSCKWIFKRNLKVDGPVEKFKAMLVIHGFKQKSGIDYFDTYAPVTRISTIRLLIAMTSIHNLIIHQMDVKTAFLNGKLEKKAPKQWHQKFNEMVLSNGYLLNQADRCVYSKFDASGKGIIIFLYVDDMLIFGTDQVQVDLTKKFLSSRFLMKEMGEADVILGIRIKHKSNDTCEKLMPNIGLAVSQLEYSRVISCLMYAMTCTRPDIAFVVGKLSSGDEISWASKKQTCITCSIMESEFVALATTSKEAKWLKNLLFKIPMWVKPMAHISIRCNSAATLAKAYSQMYNGKSRHLGVKHSMIHELITNGVVSIEFVRSQQNLADHLTKGLARDLVIKSAEWMGLKSK